jgi:hypothetical protein
MTAQIISLAKRRAWRDFKRRIESARPLIMPTSLCLGDDEFEYLRHVLDHPAGPSPLIMQGAELLRRYHAERRLYLVEE